MEQTEHYTTRPEGTRPVWVDPEERTHPTLSEDLEVEVAVVGAGITGIGTAYRLKRAGVDDLAVLERRSVCSGASGRNAGFVMAVAPENFPPTDDALERVAATRIWKFTAENQRLLEETIADLRLDVGYRKLGSLGLAARAEEWTWILASTEVAREAGLGVEIVDRQDLPGEYLRQTYHGGAWYPKNAEIHPGLLVRGVADQLSRDGVPIFERSPVTSMETDGGRFLLRCNGRVVRAQSVILATNAYTAELAPGIGRSITPTRGQVLCTAALARQVAPCPVYANDGFQYWRQLSDGRLLVGGWRDLDFEGERGVDERLHADIQARLTSVAEALAGDPVEIEYRWSGIMGFTPDRRPLVGLVSRDPDLLICAGFSGHGLAMGWMAASQAVEILLGNGSPYQDLFDPLRFATHGSRPADPAGVPSGARVAGPPS